MHKVNRSTQAAPGKHGHKISQVDLILGMLRNAREKKELGVGVPDMMRAGVAHFTARMFELRKRGFAIGNHLYCLPDGQKQSYYFLIFDPERDAR